MRKLVYGVLIALGLLVSGCTDAGKDQTVTSGTLVTLDGSKSQPSVGGTIKEYQWKQTQGKHVELSSESGAVVTFVAPSVKEKTRLVFRLKTVEYGGNPRRFRSYAYTNVYVVPKTEVPDTTPPVITLKGDNPVILTVGDTYVEPGATATDDRDGNVSVTVSGNVDTKTPGKYTVTYRAVDAAGNDASATRTVIVKKPANTVAVQGRVTDVNGTGIPGAVVTIGEQEVIADADGNYTFPAVTKTDRIAVNVSRSGYFANSRIISTKEGRVQEDIVLDAPAATLQFDSTEGATVSEGKASVQLPAGGYVDANGTAYNGSVIVTMHYHPITTRSGRASFPGSFEGIEGNTTFPIQSYGFMNVELNDPQGHPLNLDGNTTATLTFPADYSLNTPSTVPLWYYDVAQGYWVQEGTASNSGHYGTYTGTVTHFTSWNLDAKGPRAKYTGCVEDANGSRVSGAVVQFSSLNWISPAHPTDENGNISVYNILAERDLTFGAFASIGGIAYYGDKTIHLVEGEEKVDASCVVLQRADLSSSVTVTGTFVYKDQPLKNASVSIADARTNKVLSTATTDNEGHFVSSFAPTDTVQYGVRINDGDFSGGKDFILKPHKSNYDLGEIHVGIPR